MRTVRPRSRARRGAEAIEFAMVMPILIAMVFGAADYGLLYFQRLQAFNAIQQSVRAGALVRPTDDELDNGGCAQCLSAVVDKADTLLAEIGATPRSGHVAPTLQSVGGICVIDLDVVFHREAVLGLVGVPESYEIRFRLPAQSVKDC